MGMYTELTLKVSIEDKPEVVEILAEMIKGSDIKNKLNHPFFRTSRCNYIFFGDSYYFDSQAFVKFKYDKIAKCWFLTTCFNLKNYDQEIQKFLDWLCPYILTEGYIGTYWHEEQEEPLNIYKENGQIIIGNHLNSF